MSLQSDKDYGDKKLGQILIDMKFATISQVADALAIQKQIEVAGTQYLKLGQILLFESRINLTQLQSALRQQVKKAEATRESSLASMREDRRNRTSGSDLIPEEESSFWGKLRKKILKRD